MIFVVILVLLCSIILSYTCPKIRSFFSIVDPVVSVLAIISIIYGVHAYYDGMDGYKKQLQVMIDIQNKDWNRSDTIKLENQRIYLDNSKVELGNNIELIDFIKKNIEEFKNTSSIPLGRFNFNYLKELIIFYPNLDTREVMINTISDMENMNRTLNRIESANNISQSDKQDVFIDIMKFLPSILDKLNLINEDLNNFKI